MSGFEVLTAVAVPFAVDKVDTDRIFPSRFQAKKRADGKFGEYFLHDERFDEKGKKRGDCILNDSRYEGAKIIVAASAYACGSARPPAIYAHLDFGIEVIIAESFGPVFPTVSYKSGLLSIQLPKDEVGYLRGKLLEQPGSSVTVDLKRQVVMAPDGKEFAFDIDPFVKKMFIKGISEINLTMSFQEKIEAFEARQMERMPWLY